MRSIEDRSASGLLLCNDHLRAHILPEEGGRIASFFDVQSGLEFLLQPSPAYQGRQSHSLWDRFENSACAGIDDCLPSVGACGAETPGGPVPDHGDFWRLHWTVLSTSKTDSVNIAATGYSRHLHLEKSVRLHDASLELQYRIRNLKETPVPFLYALHPLLAIDPEDRILLPPEVTNVRIDSSRGQRLGNSGTVIAWPKPHGPISDLDLSRTEAVTASTAEMLYTGPLQSGWCGLYRARSGNGIVVRFNARTLPYLGLWFCYGGWPEDPHQPRQYAVAFEPTVAPWGTLTGASEKGEAPVLAGHASFSFAIAIERIGPSPMTYDEFAARCLGPAAAV